jgi:hypothetical protein
LRLVKCRTTVLRELLGDLWGALRSFQSVDLRQEDVSFRLLEEAIAIRRRSDQLVAVFYCPVQFEYDAGLGRPRAALLEGQKVCKQCDIKTKAECSAL